MNERYFACQICKNYIDAGYRFCCWALERPGIIEPNKPVNLKALWGAEEYWSGGEDCTWLADLLPRVRDFLVEHQEHDLVFCQEEYIGVVPMYDGDYRVFEWLNEPGFILQLLPRYFFERLGFRTWKQVVEYVESEETKPWWWEEPEYMARGKAKFLLLVRSLRESKPSLGAA